MLARPASTRNRRTRQRGEVLLEAALVFTVAVAMVLFILDMGRLLFYKEYFSERARVGARWAAVNTWNSSTSPAVIANVVCYNAPTGSGPGYFGLDPSSVVVTPIPGPGNPRYIAVSIRNFSTFTLIPFMAGKFTMPPVTATAVVQSLGAVD